MTDNEVGTKLFTVTIPIAGHAYVDVKAESEKEAIEKAFNMVNRDDIEEWEALEQFNSGHICHCPSPREVEVVEN